MVEGAPSVRLGQNQADDGIEIVQHIGCRNVQRSDACLMQGKVAGRVALRSVAAVMRLAVDFDRKAGLATEEVDHERTQRMLPAEFQAFRALAQHAPQKDFRQAHSTAEASGSIDRAVLLLDHRSSPATMLRMVPLPEQTRGGFRV
jgi:hypothetical protein